MGRSVFIAGRSSRERVAEAVRDLIRSRNIRAGGKLPTYHELCRETDAAYATVKFGLDILEGEGLVRRIPSKGTFLTKDLTRAPRPLENVGLIFPSSRHQLFTSPWTLEIMRGISLVSPPCSDLHVFSIRNQGFVSALQLGEWMVDGVVLLNMENDDYLRMFATWGTPGVVVDYCPRDVSLDYVACDNEAAVRRMVEHLGHLGHRRVACAVRHPATAMIPPKDGKAPYLIRDSSDARERREGTLAVLRSRGMLAGDFFSAERAWGEWAAWIAGHAAQWKRQPDPPTAIVVDCDANAADLVDALRHAGVRVPEDISVCAVCGTDEFARRGTPVIACCRFDFVGMGRMAVELLAERCRRPAEMAPRARRIGFVFVEGETTGRRAT